MTGNVIGVAGHLPSFLPPAEESIIRSFEWIDESDAPQELPQIKEIVTELNLQCLWFAEEHRLIPNHASLTSLITGTCTNRNTQMLS